MSDPSLRLCKSCRHFVNNNLSTLKYGKCRLTARLAPSIVDPVDGSHTGPVRELKNANTERGEYGDCGEGGVLYEHEPCAIRRFRNAWQAPVLDTLKDFAFIVAWFLVCFVLISAVESWMLI